MDAPRRQKRRRAPPPPRSTGSRALADGTASALFVVCFVAVGQLAKWAQPHLELSLTSTSLALVLALLIVMSYVCDWLGGALFNPANNAFLWATGHGSGWSHTVRSVAQCLGGVVGALLAKALLPEEWTAGMGQLAVGLRSGAGLLDGAACEFVLGALLSFLVLWCGELKSSALRLWLPLLATVLAVKAGEQISGPSLNPAFTFAFVFCFPAQTASEHFVVYWLAPVAAGVFGGWAFKGWQQQQGQRRQQQRAKQD